MRYIKKTGTPFEAKGRGQTKAFIDSCWQADSGEYIGLVYDRSRLGQLEETLVDEQRDGVGNSYCCYCMRKLYLSNVEDHVANVTLEHIIPHQITDKDWNTDKNKYQQFPNLNDKHVSVCIGGELSEEQKITKITGMPYPHYVSYHNLVASCDGKLMEQNTLYSSRCCNNKRQERFVLPIYLDENLSKGIGYTKKGELEFDDEVYDDKWFDKDHLNLCNSWIVLVRRLWYRIAISEYTAQNIEDAKTQDSLRRNIIDDIDFDEEIDSWFDNKEAWNLLSEYSWFYGYYKSKFHK